MSTTSKFTLMVLLTLAAMAASVSSQAQPLALHDSTVFKACGNDLRKHCSKVSPGGGRMLTCLQQQGEQLSATCQAELPKLTQCRQEIQRLCGDGTPAQWRVCFESKQQQFSPECQQMAPR